MRIRLKPLSAQTVVITGATSGVGLAVARKAAARGARLVLAARNDDALAELTEDLRALGAEVIAVTADVGNEADVRAIAEAANARFGGFDTWVNNAGITIFGPLDEVSLADHHRLFDTNYWGVVHGSLVAAGHLRRHGGALINIGCATCEHGFPLQGAFSASKLAVKGFTETLRMELAQAGAPVSVSLIRPSSLDTPANEHARNYLPVAPLNPAPVYAMELAADAVLQAAEHPVRDLVVGGGGRVISLAEHLAPRLTDRLLAARRTRTQRSDRPADASFHHSLYAPEADGATHAPYPSVRRHPDSYGQRAAAGVAIASGLVLWWLLGPRRPS